MSKKSKAIRRREPRPRKAAGRARAEAKGPRKGKAGRTRARRPRSQPLPGLEDVRIAPLDDICVSISETREQINNLRKEEADLEKVALKRMRAHDRTSWRHSGVELIRVPGEEKLRVRTSKESATAEVEDERPRRRGRRPVPDPVFEASGGRESDEAPEGHDEAEGGDDALSEASERVERTLDEVLG